MTRLLLTMGVICAALGMGYVLQRAAATGRVKLAGAEAARLRRRLQRAAAYGLLPFSAMLSLWGLPEPDTRFLALPLLGILAWTWGAVLAWLLSRLLGLDRRRTGSLCCCGAFGNVGAVGSLVCVMFWGEHTVALAALYRLCEELLFFSVAFPAAQWCGKPDVSEHCAAFRIRVDPVVYAVLGALAVGIVLNAAGFPRPIWVGYVASGSAILATALFLVAVGMGLHPSRIRCCIGECLGLCAIKFAGVPAVITGLAWALGYGDIEGGLPLRVVAVLSSMPVAMTALVPPSLFGLDTDLADACWLTTTAALVVVLPVLAAVVPLL